MDKMLPNNTFYDELAADYDEMISFDSAVGKKKTLLKSFVIAEMKSAADIGCGSGVDSIALASLGLKVTAFDPSTEMLKVAKANTDKMSVKIEFYNYSADNIPEDFNNQFDLVVSLGNTFANIPKEKFLASLQRCYEILRPKGQLLIQVLNYEKILADKRRVVSITEGNDKYFIRFYDFIGEQIVFNILTFSKSNTSDFKLTSTRIHPHQSEDFISGFQALGFNHISHYGDLNLSDFIPAQSKDLIIKAVKN